MQCLKQVPDDIHWVAMPPAIKLLLLDLSYTLPNNSWQNLLLEGELSDHICFGLFLLLSNCIAYSQISLVEGEHPFSHIT